MIVSLVGTSALSGRNLIPSLSSLPFPVDIAIDGNEVIGSMKPVCDGPAADNLNFVSVDIGISCQCNCIICETTDTSCNLIKDIEKGYFDIYRDVYSEAEDIVFIASTAMNP
jgi:hypothetical protein